MERKVGHGVSSHMGSEWSVAVKLPHLSFWSFQGQVSPERQYEVVESEGLNPSGPCSR